MLAEPELSLMQVVFTRASSSVDFGKSSPGPGFAAHSHYVAFDTLVCVCKYEKAEHQYLIHFFGKRSLHLSYEVHLI